MNSCFLNCRNTFSPPAEVNSTSINNFLFKNRSDSEFLLSAIFRLYYFPFFTIINIEGDFFVSVSVPGNSCKVIFQ